MNISLSTSAVNLINTAQHRSANAGKEIAELPIQKNEVGSSEFNSKDVIKPLLSLKAAELETSAAAKLINADNKTLGSLIDLKA